MIEVQLREKGGGEDDHEAVAVDGLPVMIEITGFSETSKAEALYRLASGLEYLLGADALDLEIELPGGATRNTTTSRLIDAYLEESLEDLEGFRGFDGRGQRENTAG